MPEPDSEYTRSEVDRDGKTEAGQQQPPLITGRWISPPPAWDVPASAAKVAPEPGPDAKKSFWRRFFSLRKIVRDIVIPLVVAFVVAFFTQATVAKPYQIPSGSMLPTIQLHDRIIANRLVYHFSSIERGDIIVFEPPEALDPDTPYVKRVIGLPGDTVEIRNGQVLVNGEEYQAGLASKPSYTMKEETVPESMLFVLGDNRNESYDSHRWGFVPEENVIGRAELIYWPLDHLQMLGD